MPNTVYDHDADQAHDVSQLKSAEQRADQAHYDREFDNIAGGYGDTAEHPLGERESSATQLNESEKAAADDTVGKGYTAKSKPKGKLSSSTKQKILITGGVTGGLGVIGLIIFLFILASSLQIPDLMQNVTTYEFARVTRDYAKSETRVTTEKMAVDAADDGLYSSLKSKYATASGKLSEQWSKLDKYRPEKVMQNLSSENNFQMTFKRTVLGRQQLLGVTLGDQTFLPTKITAAQRFTPGLNSILEFKQGTSLTKDVYPSLNAALRSQDVGPIVRGVVAKKIREQLGISLVAWTLGKYQGKNETQARLEEARQKAQAIDEQKPPNDAVTSTTKDAVNEAEDATDKALADDKLLQQTIDNGGVSPTVRQSIGDALAKTPIQDIVGGINQVYAIAMPICMVYDGSLDHSGSTINNQVSQQQHAYYWLASAADQQKAGSQDTDATHATELATATHATTQDLGDINQSNAIVRANGGTPDTTTTPSAEASAGGEFTLMNVALGSNAVADTINSLADGACPVITNIWGGIGLGAINIAIGFFTGGTSAEAETVAGATATKVISDVGTNIITRMLSKTVAKAGRVKELLYDTGKSAAKVAAMTVIAKLIVNARAGQLNGGFNQGPSLADEADSGGNIHAGEVERQGLYGRAMTPDEVAQSDQADTAQIAMANRSKSVFERYLATDNANSLLSRMALSVHSNLNPSIFRSVLNVASMALRPMTYVGSLATSLNGTAHAVSYNQHYSNVQFGWPDSEQKLIDSREDYRSSLENQAVLDQSGKEDEIASKYGKCFTGQLGDLLENGDIIRDKDGNVLPDQGTCAPNNLGPNNSNYSDLVFRWRLAMQYSGTVDQLANTQEITKNSDSSTSNTGTGLNASAAESAAKSADAGGTTVGYAVYDSSGAIVSTYNPTTANYGASITKSMLLVAYLNQVGSGSLSATAKSNLTAMIENSDNAASNWVYGQLSGGSGAVNKVASDAGMSGFKIDTSDSTYVLGQSTITAGDFAKFFARIDTLLAGPQQSFGLGLLSHLSAADQTGLLQAGLPGTVYSKEGWKPESSGSRGAPYIVNQAAQFSLNGKAYGIAVTVGGTANQASGEAIVQSIAKALVGK